MAEESTRPPTIGELTTGRARGPGRLQRLPIPEHVRKVLQAGHALAGRRLPNGGWLFYNNKCHKVDGSWNAEEHHRRAGQLAASGERLYSEDGNPLHAWRAYAECRKVGEPVPEWVLMYLERVARRLYKLSAQDRPPREPAAAIAQALEMKKPGRSGQGSVFSRFRATKSLMIALDYLWEMTSRGSYVGKKPYVAARDVAKRHGVSKASVTRAWKRHKSEIETRGATDRLLAPYVSPPVHLDGNWGLERIS